MVVGFIVGLFAGTILGVGIMAMFVSGKGDDEDEWKEDKWK